MSTKNQAGFKIIELLIVLGIVSVLTAMSLPYIVNHKKLYKSEDQALQIMDLMREASQTALTRRKTIRLEIDLTANSVLLIDEGRSPDAEFKSVPLEKTRELRVDMVPAGVTKPSTNYTDIAFSTDTVGHYLGSTSVSGHNVWAARFKSDGTVVNDADVPLNANIYVWPPAASGSTSPRNIQEVRAITLVGGSGAVRYWRHNGTQFVPFL
jgi:type II secretory pathway pseudopilin PulG